MEVEQLGLSAVGATHTSLHEVEEVFPIVPPPAPHGGVVFTLPRIYDIAMITIVFSATCVEGNTMFLAIFAKVFGA